MIVIHTALSAKYLARALSTIDHDPRIDFSVLFAEDHFSDHTPSKTKLIYPIVSLTEASLIHWDLAIVAAHHVPDGIKAKRKLHIQHGLGSGKTVNNQDYTYGYDFTFNREGEARYDLMFEASEEVAKNAVSHNPQIQPIVSVVGDMACDNVLNARTKYRAMYRHALGLGSDDIGILVSSTWGKDGLLEGHGRWLLRALLDLPEQFKLLVAAHPHAWKNGDDHSEWANLLAILRTDRAIVCYPSEDFGPYFAAADAAIIDHSSMGLFSALCNLPCAHVPVNPSTYNPGSLIDELIHASKCLYNKWDLISFLGTAVERKFSQSLSINQSRITSRPYESEELIRNELYGLIGLSLPTKQTSPEYFNLASVPEIYKVIYALYEHLLFGSESTPQHPQNWGSVSYLDRKNHPQLSKNILSLEYEVGMRWLRDIDTVKPSIIRGYDVINSSLKKEKALTGIDQKELIAAIGSYVLMDSYSKVMRWEADFSGKLPRLAATRIFHKRFTNYRLQSKLDLPLYLNVQGSSHAALLDRARHLPGPTKQFREGSSQRKVM